MYWIKLLLLGFISLITLASCKDSGKSKANCNNVSNVKLESNNVKDIVLKSSAENHSGTAVNNQSRGYQFVGKKGQKISYQIKPPGFCAWLFTSENKIVNDPVLPEDGTYILQVAAAENSGTFDLSINLGSNNPLPPTESATSTPPLVRTNTGELSKDEAKNIITQWLEAKKSIFGSSYNKSLGEKLTIGQAYERNIQANPGDEESSVDYLRRRGEYYTYDRQEVHEIPSIRSNGSNEAIVRAIVTEHRTIHSSNGNSKSSKNNQKSVCYQMQKNGDTWKISKDPSLLTSCN